MKTQEVKQRMEDMHITVGTMAQELGMDPSTYYRKMQKNGEEFSALDLMVFKRVLQMDEQTALDFLLS
jgi:phage terminase small subunit